jgi:hypothetical protein
MENELTFERNRIEALRAARQQKMAPFNNFFIPAAFNLAVLSEESFQSILDAAKHHALVKK